MVFISGSQPEAILQVNPTSRAIWQSGDILGCHSLSCVTGIQRPGILQNVLQGTEQPYKTEFADQNVSRAKVEKPWIDPLRSDSPWASHLNSLRQSPHLQNCERLL